MHPREWSFAFTLAILWAAPPCRTPNASAAADTPVPKGSAATELVQARFAAKLKSLGAAAREHDVKKVLVVCRAEGASDPDRPRVLEVVRDSIVAAAEAEGLPAETTAEAEAAFARGGPAGSAGGGAAAPPAPRPSDVGPLLETAPSCDAVLVALYTRKADKRAVRMVLLNTERNLATASATLAKVDVADVLAVPVTQADVDRAAERIAAAVDGALAPMSGVAEKAGLKRVAVVVVPGRGDAQQNEALGAVVAGAVERSLAGSGAEGGASATETAEDKVAFDVSFETRVRFEQGRKPGPLAPKDVKRLRGGGKDADTSAAFDGILGVVSGHQGGRASVEFTLVDSKRSLWKASARLDTWDVAEIPAVPLLNQAILSFAKAHLGEQVGNGECWTLAADAMTSAGAKPAAGYTYGARAAPGRAGAAR